MSPVSQMEPVGGAGPRADRRTANTSRAHRDGQPVVDDGVHLVDAVLRIVLAFGWRAAVAHHGLEGRPIRVRRPDLEHADTGHLPGVVADELADELCVVHGPELAGDVAGRGGNDLQRGQPLLAVDDRELGDLARQRRSWSRTTAHRRSE